MTPTETAEQRALIVGDEVFYYPVKGRDEFRIGTVTAVYPNGIPSCPEPMVMLSCFRGVVLESHCKFFRSLPGAEEGRDGE